MFIIKNRKLFIAISALFVLLSLVVIFTKGLKTGIEFTGGSALEVSYPVEENVTRESLTAVLGENNFSSASVRAFGEGSFLIKTQSLSEAERIDLYASVEKAGTAKVEQFNSIGPSIGKELKTKAIYAIIFVSLGIILFVAYSFRKVSKPVSSWKYGLVAVIALLHDIIIPVGILTLMGTEIDSLYVVGILSILGLSVNDTLVVFDRIREQLLINAENEDEDPDFSETVGKAVSSTIVRSILTSLTLVVVLVALYLAGPAATKTLSLVLLLGTIVGTYSSIFLASPMLTGLVTETEEEK